MSFIKIILNEAEMTLAPENSTFSPEGSSINDVLASNVPAPEPPAPMGMDAAFPQITAGQSPTVQKTVLNKDLVLAVFSELKSLLANYEKKFGKDDVSLEDAKIYIGSLLNTLAFNAKKLEHLISEPPPAAVPEVPEAPAELPTELPPAPIEGQEGMLTAPGEAVSDEAKQSMTNPLAGLDEV